MSESAICNSIKAGSKLWGWGPASMQVQCNTLCAYIAQTASGIALFTEHLLYIKAYRTLNLLLDIGHWTSVIVHTVLWTSKETFVKWWGWSFLNESIVVFSHLFLLKSLWNIFFFFYKAWMYEGFLIDRNYIHSWLLQRQFHINIYYNNPLLDFCLYFSKFHSWECIV